ncbi:unnamed protein product [Bursaphelenchus okinawaensis]|uniref:Protein kinase domain-containing protein n=1 Tax=Bursaphelenchus okinawaensis TaxID=465554 RepID=A0A811LMK3_9BILA|nr:unnamed protein product [Bursaphelenchus okinawaensis]CAG9124177.1 unnamed protein product [Bursaphelenchus okinawaensis]
MSDSHKKFARELEQVSSASSGVVSKDYEPIPKWTTGMEGYHYISLLGCGAVGDVFKARNVVENRFCAIKYMSFAPCNRKDIIREVKALNYLAHPNLIDMHTVSLVDKDMVLIVTPLYYSLARLLVHSVKLQRYNALTPPHMPMSEKCAGELMYQLLSGVSFMHEHGFMHRDLKSDNLMLDSYATLKIVDFGITRPFTKADLEGLGKMGTPCGTPYFMAPEIAVRLIEDNCPMYDVRAETWSCGVVLCEWLFVKPPYHMYDCDTHSYYQCMNILQYEGTADWENMYEDVPLQIKRKLSKKCVNFIENCLIGNAAKRKTVQTLMSDKWVTQYKDKKNKHVFEELLNDKVLDRLRREHEEKNTLVWYAKQVPSDGKCFVMFLFDFKGKAYNVNFYVGLMTDRRSDRSAEQTIRMQLLQLANIGVLDGRLYFIYTQKTIRLVTKYSEEHQVAAHLSEYTDHGDFATFKDHCMIVVGKNQDECLNAIKSEVPEVLPVLDDAEKEIDFKFDEKHFMKDEERFGRSSAKRDAPPRKPAPSTGKSLRERMSNRRRSASKYLDSIFGSNKLRFN